MTPPIAFIGLGHMGLGIAGRLLDAGHALHVYNRTAERARSLVERGAHLAATPRDAVTAGGIVVTMVSDDAALEVVAFGAHGVVDALGDGVHVGMSTVSPALARRLAEAHAERGGAYVSAPVFGRPEVAAQGRLWACVSGDSAARARVAPLLDAVTRGRTELGDDPSAAAVAKIAGNLLILAANTALTDALALGTAYGMSPTDLAALYGETLFASPIYQGYGAGIAESITTGRARPGGFSVALARKDAALAVDAGRASGTALHIANRVLDRLDAAVAAGLGEVDVTGLPLVQGRA